MELSSKLLTIGTLLIIFVFQLPQCNAFYLQFVAFYSSLKFHMFTGYSFPALYTMSYEEGSPVLLFEKRITGEITPFLSDYGFCEREYSPIGWLETVTLGETMSPYHISFAENKTCNVLCTKRFVGGDKKHKEQLDALKKGMSLEFKRHWILDNNIPALWCPESDNNADTGTRNGSYCVSGFPIGCYTGYGMGEYCYEIFNQFEYDEKYFIFNHVDIVITYEGSPVYPSKSKLVNVKVVPSSIKHYPGDEHCNSDNPLEIPKGDIPLGQSLDVTYTYSIKFIRNDDIKWSSRWNYIFKSMPFSNLNWIQLSYSVLAVFFIILVSSTIITTIYKNDKSYKMMEGGERVTYDICWKIVYYVGHPDPAVRLPLSVLLGLAVQFMLMSFGALAFSLLAYVQPNGRDVQMLAVLLYYILLGYFGGGYTSFFYKNFGGVEWKIHFLISCIVCPGVAVSPFVIQDCILFFIDSSASLPFYSLGGFLGVIYLLTVPFTAIGCVVGRKSKAPKTTVKKLPTVETISKW